MAYTIRYGCRSTRLKTSTRVDQNDAFGVLEFFMQWMSCVTDLTCIWHFNPNIIKSYKILQKLSPKHAAHGVAQSTYPIYRHGKACLSKQPPWRAAGDPRLARGRSQVRAPGPAGALRAFFLYPPFLPSSGDRYFFCTFPTNPAKVLGLWWSTDHSYTCT